MSQWWQTKDFSSPCPKNGYYDVFLSFRGIDTRRGFTTNLYHSLQQNNIYTFMDEKLVGKDINYLFKMIAKSRMAVVIYSERFAESKWCLKELELILQRRKEKKMLMIPIFYKVDVHDLKSPTGKTREYLDKNISNQGETTSQKWKDVVTSFGHVCGLSYKDTSDSSEYDFINNLTAKIKEKLQEEPLEGYIIKPNYKDDRSDIYKLLITIISCCMKDRPTVEITAQIENDSAYCENSEEITGELPNIKPTSLNFIDVRSSSGEDYPVRSGEASSSGAGGFYANYKDEGGLVNTMVEVVMEKLKKDASPADQLAIHALSYKQKYILLNMSCFWIGKLKYAPNYVWEDHFDGSVLHEIEELKLKSLIKIGNYKYYWIDDRLRDRAMAILQNEYNDKGIQVWEWRSGDSANLLTNNKLMPQVEAICLNGDQLTEKCIKAEQLQNLPNLRFMEIRGADITGNFQDTLLKVSYLKVAAKFKHTDTIRNLCLENIVVLDLSGSGVGDDWKWSTTTVALKMKDLNLSSCHQLIRGPNFSILFPNLERLDVEGCNQLKSIDVSMLTKLKDLDASKCKSLEDVCGLDQLIGSIEKSIGSIQWMDISGSEAVKMSPDLKSKLIKSGVLKC